MMKTDTNIARVAAVVKEDRRVGCWMIEKKTGIPKTTMQQILLDSLKKYKISTRFVPHALTTKQHYQTVVRLHNVLQMVKSDPEFLDSIITGGESWCFVYNSETKCQTASWFQITTCAHDIC